MKGTKSSILALGAMVSVLAGRACADVVMLELSKNTKEVIEGLGGKLVLSALVFGVSAIICTALLRKQ
jgi:hypothetical protein